MNSLRCPHEITFKAVVSAVIAMRSLTSRFTAQSGFGVFINENERTAP